MRGMNTENKSEQVWFIPGWLRSQKPIKSIMRVAQQTFPHAKVCFKAWDGESYVWSVVLANAEKEAWKLVFEIAVMPDAQRRQLTLVGHSLGARMIIRALVLLAEHQMQIRQAILMGAALPADDPDFGKIGKACERPILAICNPKDVVLRYIYAVAGGERDVAFGANGSLQSHENVVEYVLPATITRDVEVTALWAKIAFVKALANHHELFYFNYLKQVLIEGKPAREIMVPQSFPTLPLRVLDREVWWRVLIEDAGWKLEKHIITGHCRILNPQKVRTAWGWERKMRLAFDKVMRQVRLQETRRTTDA